MSSWVRTTTAVSLPGRTRASASSGHATISSSALGIRSAVANLPRASATIVCQPSRLARRQSSSAVSTAPMTSSRGGGPNTSAKILPSSVRWLRPRRSASPSSVESVRVPTPSPSTTVNRTARSPRSSNARMRRDKRGVRFLDEHVDLSSAGQSDRERELVGDPVGDELRRRSAEHLLRVLVHVVLDASARHRAGHLAAVRDHQLRADRARSRAACRDDGRECEPLAARLPALGVGQDLSHGEIVVSRSREQSRMWSRANSSPPAATRARRPAWACR